MANPLEAFSIKLCDGNSAKTSGKYEAEKRIKRISLTRLRTPKAPTTLVSHAGWQKKILIRHVLSR